MKLNQNQIQEIDQYLQFLGVKFIDVRLELIDHLATEFETESKYVLLGDFLRTKGNFVRKFQKQWDKSKHWGHQKALLLRVLRYFRSPLYIFISLGIALFIYLSFSFLVEKIVFVLFFVSISVPQALYLYQFYKPKGMHKKIQSVKYLGSIMALPSMFLYLIGLVTPFLKEYTTVFAAYWFFAVIFNIAGIEEVMACKKKIVDNYSNLIKS